MSTQAPDEIRAADERRSAVWFSIPVFGLALFFHARYFDYYRRGPWMWGVMMLAVLVMAAGLVGAFAPGMRRLV